MKIESRREKKKKKKKKKNKKKQKKNKKKNKQTIFLWTIKIYFKLSSAEFFIQKLSVNNDKN